MFYCLCRIEGLLNLTCKTFANTMKNMTNEEVRTMLNIDNDFTPEEAAEQWNIIERTLGHTSGMTDF